MLSASSIFAIELGNSTLTGHEAGVARRFVQIGDCRTQPLIVARVTFEPQLRPNRSPLFGACFENHVWVCRALSHQVYKLSRMSDASWTAGEDRDNGEQVDDGNPRCRTICETTTGFYCVERVLRRFQPSHVLAQSIHVLLFSVSSHQLRTLVRS